MLIAYQSLNSNPSSTHDVAASTMQRFTRDANAHAVAQGHKALVLPHDPMDITTAVEGPAQLVPVAPLPPKTRSTGKKRGRDDADDGDNDTKKQKDGQSPTEVIGAQISLLWQNFYRPFQRMPDIMVCGELDASHPDFKAMLGTTDAAGKTVLTIEPQPATKACQSFTAFSQSSSQARRLGGGIGYVVYHLSGMNIVFVHVPNEICKNPTEVQLFYRKIANTLLQDGKIIHLVIGDTNQGSAGFTAKALNDAFSTKAYRNALEGKAISPVDNYGNTQFGTNAKGTELYDVAVYHSDVVHVVGDVAYVSQSSGGITVTDHYGLAIRIAPAGAAPYSS